MSNPTLDKFYRLIRRIKEVWVHQRLVVYLTEKRHAEKSFCPVFQGFIHFKGRSLDSAFLELCNDRHKLIEQLCKESESDFEPITVYEVLKAISQLNSNVSLQMNQV